MSQHYELFFTLLRVAVGKADKLPRTPNGEEWKRLYNEAVRQALVGVIYGALERLPREQLPPKPLLFNWFSAAETIRDRNKQMDKDCVWISEYFAKAGFRTAILKGQGNAQMYPDPTRRQSGDIDIWLEGDLKTIIDYVLKLFPHEKVWLLEVKFPIKEGTEIEVHIIPSDLYCPTDDRRLQAFYDKHKDATFSNEIPIANSRICVPVWDMNVMLQLTHIYRHLFFEGVGLRQVMDYYYLLRSVDITTMKRERVKKSLKALHLTRFASALMWVLKDTFGIEDEYLLLQPDETEGRFLLQEILLAGNFGHYDHRNNFKTTKWGKFWQRTLRNTRFTTHYPREVLWCPIYRIYQYIWKKTNGYD